MTAMLASVNNLEEALLINDLNVGIIDLKQPAEGALGALPINTVLQIVDTIKGNKPVSATVGDLPMQADLIFDAVKAMAKTGVDFIKIGFFPGNDWQDSIEKLSSITANHALIAVLFADTNIELSVIKTLHQAGFKGVMLDTMDKRNGSLPSLLTNNEIKQFIQTAKQHDLLTGLAGSLKETDIPALLSLNADFMGFRGALCEQNNRTAQLNKEKTATIIEYFSMLKKPAEDYELQQRTMENNVT